jgi:hypothetical protein
VSVFWITFVPLAIVIVAPVGAFLVEVSSGALRNRRTRRDRRRDAARTSPSREARRFGDLLKHL